jgi:hypothetical protein
MESLKHWLEIIAVNGERQRLTIFRYYSHKEISLIVSSLISEETTYPYPIRLKIHPLLHNLKKQEITHNHKSNIAKFIISIIDDYEKDLNNPNCF